METSAEAGLRYRARQSTSTGSFSKYGATIEPPKDDAIFYPDDDTHSFFAQGRDFESAYVNHKYTEKERQTLGSYESLDYLPSHSIIYKHWIKRQPARLDWDRWVMMGLIGFAVGLVGFLLHQIIDLIADTKWDIAKEFIKDGKLLTAWGFVLGYSVLFVILSAGLVVFLRPSAGGSGLPELIGFLNGTVVRHIFNIKTMVVKFLSCCCAVGSGMPIGPEGPMIHLGSLVGAGLSQFKSDTLKIKLPFFERFRNSEDRRNFVSAGAAAGVASAFGAPVGGLLFSMEEVSSFWNQRLSWQIFFCAMVSTFTTDLFNSAFTGFRYTGNFGLFRAEKYILFKISKGLSVHILTFIPAIILGAIGGILGALFNFINLKMARLRRRALAVMQQKWKQDTVRMAEPIIIMIVVSTISIFLPKAFGCTSYTCLLGGQLKHDCLNSTTDSTLHIDKDVSIYMCPQGTPSFQYNYTATNGSYNQMATLLFNTGEGAIHQLFTRNTHLQFDYPVLVTVLAFYFLLACWAAGTSISSGLVVPMLLIGGLYGRIVGLAMVSMFGIHTQPDTPWAWMDPGAFALIGAASFFGGVTRLTMSLTVIMIEITNDVQFLLPIMCAIMVAKWVGDFVTHPIYHALLELKCIPFLDAEPVIRHEGQRMLNLELYSARDVMASHPIILMTSEPVSKLAQLLLDVNHGGFPVSKATESGNHTFYGFINRLELTVLLMAEDHFQTAEEAADYNPEIAPIDYQQMTLDKLSDPAGVQEMLQSYCDDVKYNSAFINLEPYVNQSAVSVPEKFSLHRTYVVFRTLGLRHLTVVDSENRVVGVVTRKDLMGFSMEEKLAEVIQRSASVGSRAVELSEVGSVQA